MEKISYEKDVILPGPDHANDQINNIVTLLSLVVNDNLLWPDATNELKNLLIQMKKTLVDDCINEGEIGNMMIDTSSKPKA